VVGADPFEYLRGVEDNRREWIVAARAFERALARVLDPRTRENLQRQWERESVKPLVPVDVAWSLVRWALDEVELERPISFAEARDGGVDFDVVRAETRRWQDSMRERMDTYFNEAIPEAPVRA
jgi:hypothetical protein